MLPAWSLALGPRPLATQLSRQLSLLCASGGLGLAGLVQRAASAHEVKSILQAAKRAAVALRSYTAAATPSKLALSKKPSGAEASSSSQREMQKVFCCLHRSPLGKKLSLAHLSHSKRSSCCKQS